MKWRLVSCVFCDKNVTLKLKDKFYKVVVRLTILYGVECWPIKNSHVQKLKVAEMGMLRWMCVHTRLDKTRNEIIRDKVRVDHVEDKIPIRMYERLAFMGTRKGRSRPSIREK